MTSSGPYSRVGLTTENGRSQAACSSSTRACTPDFRREVFEGTGLRVEPLRLSGANKSMTVGVVALTLLCRSVDGILTTSDETSDGAWIASAQVGQRMEEAFAIRVWTHLSCLGQSPSGPMTATACLPPRLRH